jgi:hypothetical protein
VTEMSWPARIFVTLVIIGFLAYFWGDPEGAAGLVSGFFRGVGTAFSKIVAFFGAL